MINKKAILENTLRGCREPLVDLESFLIKYGELCKKLDKRFTEGDGFISLRIISESLKSRLNGVNPDISTLANLCGVSRDTIRRSSEKNRQKDQPYAKRKLVDGHMVYDENASTSPKTAKMLDHVVQVWRAPPINFVQGDPQDNSNEALKVFLKGCQEPLSDIKAFLFKYSEMTQILEKKLSGGDYFLVLRLISEGLRSRLDGINPDISSLGFLCNVSRDKVRRTMEVYRDKSMPYSNPKMDGRRKVYDEKGGISPKTAKALDEVVRVWKT